ncbi:hypothetical protein EVA_12416 [gut metagenome]|uniref:Uncharacterized protein n=1 Tax=gut metagenome TaxID=749906 RepID=J9GCF4_9ZZZZ
MFAGSVVLLDSVHHLQSHFIKDLAGIAQLQNGNLCVLAQIFGTDLIIFVHRDLLLSIVRRAQMVRRQICFFYLKGYSCPPKSIRI